MGNYSKKIDLNELKHLLEKKFPEISIAYIFGSAKYGYIKAGSDIDIAVLLDDNYEKLLEFKIAADIEEAFKCKVDIVVLNTANPILTYEIFKTGNRLFEKDSLKRAVFEVNAFRDYIDNIYYLRRRYAK